MPWGEHAHTQINKYINKCKRKDFFSHHGDKHSGNEGQCNSLGLDVLQRFYKDSDGRL